MKQCPVCKQTYADDRLAYCLEDGTALINIQPSNSAQSAITQPSPRVKYNPEPTLRVPPGQFTAVTQTAQSATTQSDGKSWLIFAFAALFLIVVVGAIIAFFAFRGGGGAVSNSNIANGSTANGNASENRQIVSVTPLPETTHTSADLVGGWQTSVVENKVPMDIFVTLAPSGKSRYSFKPKNGQATEDNGAWRYTDGVLFENFSNGATGKSSIKWIDNDNIDLTIIDNGVPALTGVVRHYRRIKVSPNF